ncbi:hypothetical protein GCM10018954_022100 [Kutzneria kofuensis]
MITAGRTGNGSAESGATIHILWMNGGLSCDGDSVALTAATQPSIEEILLGGLPGLPEVAMHWPLLDFQSGPERGPDDFVEWWRRADRGELDPFILVSRVPCRTSRPSPRATGPGSAPTPTPASR